MGPTAAVRGPPASKEQWPPSSPEVVEVFLAGHPIRFLDLGQDSWLERLKIGETRHFERLSLSIWQTLAGNHSTILDVGAFNGMYSLLAATTSPRNSVLAFEPMPLSYGMFVGNLLLNGKDGQVRAVHAALGAASMPQMKIFSQSGPYVMASGESAVGSGWPLEYSVDMVAFDDLHLPGSSVQGWPREALKCYPTLVKLDVEGYEMQVLEGMQSTLAGSNGKLEMIVESLDRKALDNLVGSCGQELTLYFLDEESLEVSPVGYDFPGPGNYWATSSGTRAVARIAHEARAIASAGSWGLVHCSDSS